MPGWLIASLCSRGENDALHGAALSGVDEYGEGIEAVVCAEPSAGENGDCGIASRRGVRADLGAGFANGDGGMMMRGESGLDPRRSCAVALLFELAVL